MSNNEESRKLLYSCKTNRTIRTKSNLELEENDVLNDTTSSCEVEVKWASNTQEKRKVVVGDSFHYIEPPSSATSLHSENDFSQKDAPAKEKETKTNRRERISKPVGTNLARIDSDEKRGFSESSGLSTLQTCLDDPKIKCHCRKTYNHIPDANPKQLQSNVYETAPISTCAERRLDEYKTLSAINIQNGIYESSSPGTDSDDLSNHEKKQRYILLRYCKTHQHMYDSRNDNGAHEEVIQTDLKDENVMPELYAAKVAVDSEDVPKQIIFNAVHTSDHHAQKKKPVVKYVKKKHVMPLFIYPKSSKKGRQAKVNEDEQCNPELVEQITNDVEVTPLIKPTTEDAPPNGRIERIEVYYFDHGCSGYFRTTDFPPPISSDALAEQIDNGVTRFWAEIFGALHLFTAIIIIFFLQLLRFIFYSIVRPIIIGIIQITSDYFIKPLLAILFNGFLQPIFIFIYNITTSIKDICEVVAQTFGYFLKEIANVLRAIRLVEVKKHTRNSPFFDPKYLRSDV